MEIHRGRRVEIRCEEPLPIHSDGVIVAGVRELHAEMLRGRLSVLA